MTPGCGRGVAVAAARAILPAILTLAGCARPLPYQPERQPFGATISADVRVTEDQLRVEIGSEGYRVERAMLVRDGDAEIAPEALVPSSAGASGGLSMISAAVGTGIGIPVGGPGPRGTTLAVFRLVDAGPPPWRLRVKVVGVDVVEIVLDPAARPRRP